jgi:hypothetical protein
MITVTIDTLGDPAHQVTASNGCNAPVVNGSLVVNGTVTPVAASPHVDCWVRVNNADVPPTHLGTSPDPKTGKWSVTINGLGPDAGMTADVKATANNTVPENGNTTVSGVTLVPT